MKKSLVPTTNKGKTQKTCTHEEVQNNMVVKCRCK